MKQSASGGGELGAALTIDGAGMLRGARYIPSPNCDERPQGSSIELLVLHNISLPPGEFGGNAVIAFFTNQLDFDAHPYYRSIRELRVSAHFFIRRAGELIQFVPCTRRAWHAGPSSWHGRPQCNDYSIGVELEGADDAPFADAQYRVAGQLAKLLKAAYPIVACVGHADIAPGRKTDPGPMFDWQRFLALSA